MIDAAVAKDSAEPGKLLVGRPGDSAGNVEYLPLRQRRGTGRADAEQGDANVRLLPRGAIGGSGGANGHANSPSPHTCAATPRPIHGSTDPTPITADESNG